MAPRRIGLIGGECTGKSTLTTALAVVLPGCVVDETLRAFVHRVGRPPRSDEQSGLLEEAIRREDDLARTCRRPAVIGDPAPLMTAVYSQLYFADASLVARAADHATGYDLLVWCAPDFAWVPDPGQRDGDAARLAADEIVSQLVEHELRPRGITVLHVAGPLADRVDRVARAWQPGRPEALT